MKTLRSITVLISSVLGIFAPSLALYEMPVFKESLSVIEKGEEVQRSDKEKVAVSKLEENYINVFGVRLPTKNARRAIYSSNNRVYEITKKPPEMV